MLLKHIFTTDLLWRLQRSFEFNVVYNGLQGEAVAEFASLRLETLKYYTSDKGPPGLQLVDMIFNGQSNTVSVGIVTTEDVRV